MVNVRGRKYELISSRMQGNKHVAVTLIEVKQKKGGFVRVGKPATNYGGFLKSEDFDYDTAFQLACENTASLLESAM